MDKEQLIKQVEQSFRDDTFIVGDPENPESGDELFLAVRKSTLVNFIWNIINQSYEEKEQNT